MSLWQTEPMEGTHYGEMGPDASLLHAANGGELHKECYKEMLKQRLRKPLIQHPDVLWKVRNGNDPFLETRLMSLALLTQACASISFPVNSVTPGRKRGHSGGLIVTG